MLRNENRPMKSRRSWYKIAALGVLALSFACQGSHTHPSEATPKEPYTYIDTLLKRDSILILLQNDDLFILQYPDTTTTISIQKEGILQRIPPELVSTNAHFAKVVTWYSQAQSRHVFLPLRPKGNYVYRNKQLVLDDPTTNLIVYVEDDAFEQGYVLFKVEHLITQQSITFPIVVREENGLPFYHDEIGIEGDTLVVVTPIETKRIPVKTLLL